jgi:PKD repeat protein
MERLNSRLLALLLILTLWIACGAILSVQAKEPDETANPNLQQTWESDFSLARELLTVSPPEETGPSLHSGANPPELVPAINTEPPPVADFSGAPTSGAAPLTVTFSDQSSGEPTGWGWDFGDGGTAAEQNPSHTYTTQGSFTVTLTVSNTLGTDSEAKTGYITVSTPPPVADFYYYLPLVMRAPQEPYPGIWISGEELASLPTFGPAWDQLKAVADQEAGQPDLSDQDDETNVAVLAKALVYARTGEQQYRDDVVAALHIITFGNTEDGGRTLALGRELAAYVIAADLISLASYDPDLDAQFRDKLRELLSKELDGQTLQSTHEDRPNNWGTHAGASRLAVAMYLGDAAELERAAQVFKGWLGDREAYAGFKYGELWWQCDPAQPVGINPKGCTKQGHSIDGALPEEMRRGGPFQWPPVETGYPWTALQGALVQAEILHRAGYPAWEWEDGALLRAMQFLYDIGWDAEGNDEWQPWLVNYAYGTTFPITTPARSGKNMGWTDWTHSEHR